MDERHDPTDPSADALPDAYQAPQAEDLPSVEIPSVTAAGKSNGGPG